MEGDGGELTQPTQNVLDPRRVGKQNSGFSDEDISDIICLLYPYSPFARREVARIARSDPTHVVGRDEAAAIEPDYEQEADHQAERFQLVPPSTGDHALILRLSAKVKDPLQGFQFGRNVARCDVCFANDPMKRLSNVHFRVYVNEYGVVMLEDQSTNGTFVDGHLLRGKNPSDRMDVRRTLSHGSKVKILMHQEELDLEFLVRMPKREGEFDRAYTENLRDYFEMLDNLRSAVLEHGAPGGGGHPDLFATPRAQRAPPRQRIALPTKTTQENFERMPREWKGSDKYNKVGEIGKGAFAVVHKVTAKFDGNPYAAKELDKRRFMKNGVLDVKVDNEMKIMQRVHHPNVVRYIEHFDWENRLLIIIMEFVPGGDLGKLVADRGTLPELLAQKMSAQLLSALGYLHENNITHRDVKPDNILIQSLDPFNVKLTDFGLSKVVDNEQTFLRTFCGTLLYCAPEVYSEYTEYDDEGFRQPRNKARRPPPGQRYDHAVDIWSLGGVIFYSLTSRPPYPVRNGISYSELLHQIMTTQLDTTPLIRMDVSHEAVEFLCSMLQRRPEVRATIGDLQSHAWMGGPSGARKDEEEQSLDEITDDDDDLQVGASQLSLQEGQGRAASGGQKHEEAMDDLLDEFFDEDSEKENSYVDKLGNPGPRLFGEVNVSAVGSSGVIPEDRLNISLPGGSESADPNDSMETEIRASAVMRDPSLIRRQSSGGSGGGAALYASVTGGQSADQLQSLVHDVQSQSLGQTDSVLLEPKTHKMESLIEPAGNSSYFTTSKRKPANDTSDEFEGPPQEKPTVKRLRSEGTIIALTDQAALEEANLLASIPLVKRLESGRQIDGPQDKMAFWLPEDVSTWHLQYPEMTELQRSVFEQAAEARGEAFRPGKSRLWGLAMRYFPPSQGSSGLEDTKLLSAMSPDARSRATPQKDTGITVDGVNADFDFPGTAPPPPPLAIEEEEDSLPDTLAPETQRIVPIIPDERANRALAVLESAPGSVLPGISVPISQPMMSWGRGPENSAIYSPRSETRVPKYALKILLWKEGYDPSKRPPHRGANPWDGKDVHANSDEYAFYLSTKATMGVKVNGVSVAPPKPAAVAASVPSNNGASPPPSNWIRLHDGDEIVVWGMEGHPEKTALVFRCFWGGSAAPRPRTATAFAQQLVPSSTARKLDEACAKAEKRARSDAERAKRMAEAGRDMQERKGRIETEREKSRAFEREVSRAREEVAAAMRSQRPQLGMPAAAATTATAGSTTESTLGVPAKVQG